MVCVISDEKSPVSFIVYNVSLFVWGNIVPLLVTFIGVIWCGIFKFILLGVHWALHWIFIRLLLCMFPSPHPLFKTSITCICFSSFFFTSMFQRWLFFLRFSLGSLIFFFCGAYLLLGFQWSLHVTYSIFQLHNYYLVLFFILYVSLSLFQSFYFLILSPLSFLDLCLFTDFFFSSCYWIIFSFSLKSILFISFLLVYTWKEILISVISQWLEAEVHNSLFFSIMQALYGILNLLNHWCTVIQNCTTFI